MSVDNVKKFFEKVEEDKKLQEKLRALTEKKKAQEQAAREELVRIAAAAGFKFTAAELAKARKAAAEEMSEDDLRKVAGGMGSHCPCPLDWS